MKTWKFGAKGLLGSLLLAGLVLSVTAIAKSNGVAKDGTGQNRYIVVLEDLPLATYDGRAMNTPERDIASIKLPATSNADTGNKKLSVYTDRSEKYLQFLDEKYQHVLGTAALQLGRQLQPSNRYRNALNGFATELTASEAEALRSVDGVKQVLVDGRQRLHTDSGPNWIGASDIWIGAAGFNPSGGEGVVVGIIDSGINWKHPSFADPGEGVAPGSGVWNHANPYGVQLGLCSKSQVLCNDKLVGVYDYVKDDPATAEVEENTNGLDNNGHGSHVASTAAGNPRSVGNMGLLLNISGVAPNANIISYRVCYIGDPNDADDGACQNSAILSAIDQAITDQVDVINHSVGGDASDPWTPGSTAMALLNARAAGIFVAVSAGNDGPEAASIGSPANAPWVTAVGAATHDRLFGSLVSDLTGGDTPSPGQLLGASFTDGIGVRRIVRASDYGYPLCGVGEAESMPDCASNTGKSNPFAPGTFNGEIVVCDRGIYGRVEKGKNLMLAGAGGYILANTNETDENGITAAAHCLPASHIRASEGDKLRTWLASGANHQGSISGLQALHDNSLADEVAGFSSRGPNLPPVQDVLKPDMIAPGVAILAAWAPDAGSYDMIDGTSFSSPHVAGGAALIKAVHPDWTPAMIVSAMTMTSTPALAHDYNGSSAMPFERGAGRPQLAEAINAGLYVNETRNGFLSADPLANGDPKNLNLPSMVNSICRNVCVFSRTVTDLVGGANWSATASGFPAGVAVSIDPDSFTLTSGASRTIAVTINLGNSEIIGSWVYGEVHLSSAGLPDAIFTVAVFADGGELPAQWSISTDKVSGWREFSIDGLAIMPDATFTSGGLVVPTQTSANLPQDPTFGDPYDGPEGVLTKFVTVPEDTLWLHASTLNSTANDIDLFVGLDSNRNGIAEVEEEICSSTSEGDFEYCDLFNPVEGSYWIIAQNWEASRNPDLVTLKSAVVSSDSDSPLTSTGNGRVAAGADQTIRVAWENVTEVSGQSLFGAVGIGSERDKAGNVGVIPVTFNVFGVAEPETLVLMNGISKGMVIKNAGAYDRAFIDIPSGAASLTVQIDADNPAGNTGLSIELYRMDFDAAFNEAPFATAAVTSGSALASAQGNSSNGPRVTVDGNSLSPGRWYAVVKNNSGLTVGARIRSDVTFTGTAVPFRAGLWDVNSRVNSQMQRLNTAQGYDYATTGSNRALTWYTYGEDGSPTWYLASGPAPEGDIWVARLDRYTNDGSSQQFTPVGFVSVTAVSELDHIFSFDLHGENGSDRMIPTVGQGCPAPTSVGTSFTGLWATPAPGLGGASVVVNGGSQAYLHFVYDDDGNPRWVITALDPQSPTTRNMPLLQFQGYCAVCDEVSTSAPVNVGTFTRDYIDESRMNWVLNYSLKAPLSSVVNRKNLVAKLTKRLDCQ